MQQSTNIVSFSCGNSCIICVDSYGEAYALGNNEYSQIYLKGEYFSKTFKKIPDTILGKVKRVVGIADCTFFVNCDDEVYFIGRYSYNSILFIYY